MGILDGNSPQPQQQPQQPQSGGMSQQDQQIMEEIGEAFQITPQLQQVYEKIVTAAALIIYDPATHDGIMKMLQTGGQADPANTLAKTAMTIMHTLIGRMQKAMPPPVVLVAAGAETMILLIELAVKSATLKIDVPTMARAMQLGLANLAQTLQIPPQQVQQWMQSISPENLQAMVEQIRQQQAPPAQGAQPQQQQPTQPQPAA